MYASDLQHGITEKNVEPTIESETVSTVHVNGHNALGPVVGNFANRICIEKAKKTGIAMASAFGILCN